MTTKKYTPTRRKTTKIVIIAIVLLVVALAVGVLLTSLDNRGETIRGSLTGRVPIVPDLEINGVQYPYQRDLVNILVMGIDKADEIDQTVSFRNKGQADFLLLITIDEKERTINFLQIDRDTMAEITILTVLGQEAGTRLAQICLAHGFGGTRERSSQLTVQAVEKMLFGIQIDRYVSVNMYDMGTIADSLGGIPVMISEEMEAIDPSFKKGEEILLKGDQANRFVRQRYGVGDGSNQARMLRQQVFMKAFQSKLEAEIDKGQTAAEEIYDLLSPNIFTNMSKGYTINVLDRTRDYETGSIAAFDGIHRVGSDGFMEFHPNQTALQNHVIANFTTGN